MKSANKLGFINPVKAQLFDKDGNLKWEDEFFNGIVDVGIHYMLDTAFNSGAASATWYMGHIDSVGYSALADADTMSSHAGWAESVGYSEATRPEWTADAAASRAVTNSTTVDFSINATDTLKGIFIADNNTKSGTTGTLWATALFSSDASVTSGDTLKITYTVSQPAS
jgi:hypothetical protein